MKYRNIAKIDIKKIHTTILYMLQHFLAPILCLTLLMPITTYAQSDIPEQNIPFANDYQIKNNTRHFDNINAFKNQFFTPAPKNHNNHPKFYFLSDENTNSSRSVGNTSHGYIINAKPLPQPSTNYKILQTQYQRSLVYGTDEMILLLTDTARAMKRKYKNSVLLIGNIAQNGGGDIPYSVSHNSGRDADIGYYYTTKDNPELPPDNLIKFGRNLKSRNYERELVFDVEKNTELLKLLISHPKVKVQFLFMANHLKKAVIRHLETNNESPELIEKFSLMISQPRAPHDDHLHIRIYCSDDDICASCIDRSVILPWIRDPLPVKENCIKKFQRTLKSSKTTDDDRIAAIHRLALLEALPESRNLIVRELNNTNIDIRKAALLNIHGLPNALDIINKNYEICTQKELLCTAIDALAKIASPNAYGMMLPLLEKTHVICENDTDTRLKIVKHLKYSDLPEAVPSLIELLKLQSPHSEAIMDTLQYITNHTSDSPEEWITWNDKNTNKNRDAWLISGFKEQNVKLNTLTGNTPIKPLLDAIVALPHISYNAQRTLMKITRYKPDSLEWPQFDARWHWTAYFKKRQKKYKIDLSDRDEKGCKK